MFGLEPVETSFDRVRRKFIRNINECNRESGDEAVRDVDVIKAPTLDKDVN